MKWRQSNKFWCSHFASRFNRYFLQVHFELLLRLNLNGRLNLSKWWRTISVWRWSLSLFKFLSVIVFEETSLFRGRHAWEVLNILRGCLGHWRITQLHQKLPLVNNPSSSRSGWKQSATRCCRVISRQAGVVSDYDTTRWNELTLRCLSCYWTCRHVDEFWCSLQWIYQVENFCSDFFVLPWIPDCFC